MRFSILLPTRNRLELLACAIETVHRQDFHDWEIVVSDNCSEEDIASYVQGLSDERIRYQRTERFLPVTENWSRALEASRGDYVIMLGDDDGLLRGYLSTLDRLIREHGSPEAIYTSACLYAYPGVLAAAPEGFLRLYTERPIFGGRRDPFFLDRSTAKGMVRASLEFRVLFDYNMQFFAISRHLLQRMRDKGPFYQSPYPDYYAANAVLHVADRVLVVPRPMIAIGISPKSFGSYYFGGREDEGTAFLKNLSEEEFDPEIRDTVLPGTDMNTSWLLAMEAIVRNYKLQSRRERYRELQIRSVFHDVLLEKPLADRKYAALRPRLSNREWLRYGLPFQILSRLVPRQQRAHLATAIVRRGRSHPATDMPTVPGSFANMVDVYEQFDPDNFQAG
jgi:glycosyltransferase involved in cell wall biosynthesis